MEAIVYIRLERDPAAFLFISRFPDYPDSHFVSSVLKVEQRSVESWVY